MFPGEIIIYSTLVIQNNNHKNASNTFPTVCLSGFICLTSSCSLVLFVTFMTINTSLCMLLFYCWDKTPWLQTTWEGKVSFSLQLSGHISMAEGSQGRNSNRAGNLEEFCLLACIHSLLCLLSYSTQDHQARGGVAHSDLGPPTSIAN